MRRLLSPLVAALLSAVACHSGPVIPEGAIPLRDDVFVEELRPGVWRHVSFRWFPATGSFPSNGLIVRSDGDAAVLVDTAWNPEQTTAILDWSEQQVGPVRAVIVTHAHDDRLGGLSAAHERGIPSVALEVTAERAAEAEGTVIRRPVPSGYRLEPFGVRGEIFFPGAGHTSDNAVVFFDELRVLAGTCMVRGPKAETLGNIKEADLVSWPIAIRTLQARYSQADLIIPGHGTPGGQELLAHTLSLLTD